MARQEERGEGRGRSVDWSVVAATEREKYADLLRRIEADIFGRRGEGHVHPTNERMEALVQLLGDPQKSFRSFHLTGTNGKTSTARMIDELLRGFGLRTGRYTSPHLTRVTERIVVDGEPVSDRVFVEAYRELAPYIELVDGQFDVPLSLLRDRHRAGLLDLRRHPRRRRGGRGRHGRHLGQHQRARRRGRGRHPDRAGPRAVPRRHGGARSRARRPASSSRVRWRSSPPSPTRRRRCCCAAPSRSRPPSPARARSSGCSSAASPSVASCCGCRGSAASTTRCSCRCTASTRRRTPPARSLRSRRSSAPAAAAGRSTSTSCARVRRRALAGPAGADPLGADDPARRRAQPVRHARDDRRDRRVVRVPAAGGRRRRHGRQGRHRDARAARAGGRRAGRHPDLGRAAHGRRRARRRGRADLRRRPRHRRAAPGRRDRGRGPRSPRTPATTCCPAPACW